jgi:UDP-N-acetyl-D-glucosamine dehydrogenase
MKQVLLDKITHRQAVIGILGMGYVGLPLALRFLEVGFSVIGFDIDAEKIEKLNRGEGYIKHIDIQPMVQALQTKQFQATTDFARIPEVDAIILCVPTPLSRNREPDLSFVINSTESVVPYMRAGQVFSLESTTYPGTTEEELLPRLERTHLTVGKDIFLVYSPEREDPGNPDFTTRTIPKVCGGMTPACLEIGVALYGQVVDHVVPVSSARVAEMVKILENTYRAVNIALVNELKIVADRMEVDIYEVIRAAASKPFGFTPFYPGPGLGGHCIPIDPFYLTWKAREYEVNTRFIELAGEINTSMPEYVIGKVMEALNHVGKPLRQSKILVLGLAYKKNIDDMRESPSLVLIEKLLARHAQVSYSDPYFSRIPPLRKYRLNLENVPLTDKVLAGFDCVIVSTDHDQFNWQQIKQHARLIVDTRGIYTADNNTIWRA